jgi:formate dehydrogenase
VRANAVGPIRAAPRSRRRCKDLTAWSATSSDEILTDHPKRYRALIVESGNPAHSLADSQRMREAIATLDVVVAIYVFMTETARLANYVLPAATQFEKYEATFFNFEFPRNVFHLRRPLLTPPVGPLPEPEIHARLVEAADVFKDAALEPLRAAARRERRAFAAAFTEATGNRADSWRRSFSTARSEKRFRTVPPPRRPCGPSRIAARA